MREGAARAPLSHVHEDAPSFFPAEFCYLRVIDALRASVGYFTDVFPAITPPRSVFPVNWKFFQCGRIGFVGTLHRHTAFFCDFLKKFRLNSPETVFCLSVFSPFFSDPPQAVRRILRTVFFQLTGKFFNAAAKFWADFAIDRQSRLLRSVGLSAQARDLFLYPPYRSTVTAFLFQPPPRLIDRLRLYGLFQSFCRALLGAGLPTRMRYRQLKNFFCLWDCPAKTAFPPISDCPSNPAPPLPRRRNALRDLL